MQKIAILERIVVELLCAVGCAVLPKESDLFVIQFSATSQRLVDLFFSMVTQLDLKLIFGAFIKTMENSARLYL